MYACTKKKPVLLAVPITCSLLVTGLLVQFASQVHAVTTATHHQGVDAARIDEYDIFRNDRRVGTHMVKRLRSDDRLVVEIRSRIRITLIGFELYRFHYDAREEWDESGLLSLSVQVDDDGKPAALEGKRQDNEFQWQYGQMQASSSMPVYPTNHWNAAVLDHDAVLNTLTGKINKVNITRDVTNSSLQDIDLTSATRYRYEGQLQLSSWYSDDGDWLAMQFIAKDGSVIDYRCSNCKQVQVRE